MNFTPAHIRKSKTATFCGILLAIFLVLFPKGGFTAGGVPLTWGYLLLIVFAAAATPWALLTLAPVPRSGWLIYLMSAPIQIALIYSAITYPITEKGYAIAELTTFIGLPLIYLILFRPLWDRADQNRILRAVQVCVFAAAAYGIFLFFWRMYMGYFIEVPYLTLNAADVGLTGTIKENARGNVYKLISTYANGNIYGVGTLILLPLFDRLEGATRWRKIVVRLALALTLSRTVWICLLLSQIVKPVTESLSHFPKFQISLRSVLQILMLFPLVGIIGIALQLMGSDFSFFFDSSFGGRSEQFAGFSHFSFLPARPLTGIEEVVYASTLNELGVLGFVGITLLLNGPWLLSFWERSFWRDPIKRAALQGVIIYAAAAGMDGAINYIPIMAFWWFLTLLLSTDSVATFEPALSDSAGEPKAWKESDAFPRSIGFPSAGGPPDEAAAFVKIT